MKLNKSKHTLKRVVIYIIGVLFLALGVVLNTQSGLGASTTNVVALVISGGGWLTLGQASSLVYILEVIFQIIVYRKIVLKVILQIPFSIVFGWLVDVCSKYIYLPEANMGLQIVFLILGILLTALGISMVINMDYISNPPDGATQAIETLTNLPFGRAKLVFDGIMLVMAVIISLIMYNEIQGVGIGTLIAFLTIGNLVSFFDDKFEKFYLSAFD